MIFQSLLDVDVYKFYMMQIATDYFPNQVVEYKFKNRTKNANLKSTIKESDLRAEIEHIKTLKFQKDELDYLKSLGIFGHKILNHLSQLQLKDITIDYSGTEIEITCKGKWADIILWETIVLSVVNELYCNERIGKNRIKSEQFGLKELYRKIGDILFNPRISFMDFGTRRRFSRDWHERVVTILQKNLPESQFIGTSNVYLAKKLGLKPIGTNAHELYMFASGYFDDGSDESLIVSQHKIYDMWYSMYGERLSISLTDTFGSDAFLNNFTKERAEKWKGFRHDSGDPFNFGDKLIKYLKENGIDPTTKTIVFSDGLDVNLVNRLELYFNGRIKLIFGIGTNLTNDVGLNTLSIVMKMTKVFIKDEVRELVKLSDNTNKITGNDAVIERYKRAFNYTNNKQQFLYS